MTIDPWILAFSGITVIATIWLGFRSAKRSKTASDFFVAGRSVSVGWNASAISGEYLSAASFMGIAEMVMSSGYDALWYPVCYACGYLFLLLFIAGPLRRFGAYTIPDFAEGRFDAPVFRKIAVVFVLFIGFFYTMPQMKGAGTTLAYVFPGLPYWVGVVLVGSVSTFNVALGGMKGITLVQAFQYWAKMFAISVPIFVLMAVYGPYGKQLGMNSQRSVFNVPFSTNLSGGTLKEKGSTADLERLPGTAADQPIPSWANPVRGPGLVVQGHPKRLNQEFADGVEKSGNAVDRAKLALLRMTYDELSRTNFNADAGLALSLIAKHESRSVWFLFTANAPPPSNMPVKVLDNSASSRLLDRFRPGFSAGGLSFLESSNDVVLVPSSDIATLKPTFDRFGIQGLHCHELVQTGGEVLGLIDSALWPPRAKWTLSQVLKQTIGRNGGWRNLISWAKPRQNSSAPWPVYYVEVFSRLSDISGDRLLIAYELIAAEHPDRDFGIWVQFPGSLNDRDWARAAWDALATNGIVVADGLTYVRTNRCVIVEGAGGAKFILPKDRAHLYLGHPLLQNNPRRPLPAKAPRDEAWLNPFGPLTTKAARSAAAALGKKGPSANDPPTPA